MMEKELKRALEIFGKRGVSTFSVDVVDVDKSDGSCTVTDGEIEFTEVQLQSIKKIGNKGFFVFPKVGSSVLVAPIYEDIKRLHVVAYSEIDQLDVKVENMEFKLDSEGLQLTKNGNDFAKLIDDLFVEIIKPDTSGGLHNVAELNRIKLGFKSLLKQS